MLVTIPFPQAVIWTQLCKHFPLMHVMYFLYLQQATQYAFVLTLNVSSVPLFMKCLGFLASCLDWIIVVSL